MTDETLALALRPVLSLDGLWDFAFEGPTAKLDGSQIRTPGIWQTQFPQLRNALGVGHCRRSIDIPADWRGRAIYLVMEGVFHYATVRVEGCEVARHGDGWTPIIVDVSEALAGKAQASLAIDARLPDDRVGASESLSEALAAKQDWYGLQGGIWKSARLEARNPLHISDLDVQTSFDLKNGALRARGRLSAPPDGAQLRLMLKCDGACVAARDFPLDGETFDVSFDVDDVASWSPQAPNMHQLEIALIVSGAPVDAIRRTVGFRRFEARDRKLYLNGRPFEMFAALDQDWHPEEECRAPEPAFLEQRFRNAKAMGLNALRCHVKIPDPLYFDLADRLGLIIWLDMPYCEFLTAAARATVERVFKRNVADLASHPSICIWTLFNEGWGIDLDDNPDNRAWLKGFFDEAKAAVPHSLVVDNSPCFPRNYHVKTDIADFHWYNGFPHQNAAFAATTSAFAAGASWVWSPHGDAAPSGGEPLICSEFGVWGLPHPSDIMEPNGSEPWWFESGHDWNLGSAYPHGVATRFRDAQLQPIFGDLDGFVDAAQEFQFRALKYQIETLRWERAISGYVITELNDTQWESNGLMDVRNNPRRFAARLAELQTPWLAIARAPRTTLLPGESVEIVLRLAGAGDIPDGATMSWRFGGASGQISASAAPQPLTILAPAFESISVCALELDAHDGDGRLLSQNRLEFCVVPALGADAPALYPIDDGAAQILAALRWPKIANEFTGGEIILATRLETPVRERIIAGAEVLLIANAPEALVDSARKLPKSDRHNFPKMLLRARDGTPWDGQWMGAFSWRRKDGAWAKLPNGPMLDEHWSGLLPDYVLTSFLATAFSGLVDAGIAVGWLHHAAAFSKRTLLGAGSLQVTTFALNSSAASENPLAPHLLAALAAS